MQYQDITVSDDAHVGVIRLSREDTENALVPEGSEREMHDVLERFRNDHEIRVVVITGTGTVFSRGGGPHAIEPRPEPPVPSLAQRLAYGYSYGKFWDYFPEYKKPVVAGVNGYCADGAWDLAMLCDLVVAAESARFHMNHVDMGIFPCHRSAHLLVQAVGKFRAADIIYNGRCLSAGECLELGLVNRVVPDDQLEDVTMHVAKELASRPPLVVSLTKQALVHGMRLHEAHAYETALAFFLRTTDDTVGASRAWAAGTAGPEFTNR